MQLPTVSAVETKNFAVAAFLKDGLVTSKIQGAEWGLENVELKYQKLICDALKCYASDKKLMVKKEEAQVFAEYMLALINDIIVTKKPHPCQNSEFLVLRIGADFKIRCTKCGREVMVPRAKIEKNIKKIITPQSENQ